MSSRGNKLIFLVLGHFFCVLGVVAILLPLMPSVPFFLLAASCYAKGSERFHQAILDNRFIGPSIRDWQEHKSIPPRAKFVALISLCVSTVFIFITLKLLVLRILLLLVVVSVAIFILSRPSRGPFDENKP